MPTECRACAVPSTHVGEEVLVNDSTVARALLSPAGRAAVTAGEPGQIIKLARTALGWKQQDLAERSGYSQPTISRLERGVGRAVRDTAILTDLANTLGLPAEMLGLVRVADPTPSLDSVDRRDFLGGAIALAAAAMLPQRIASPGRVGSADVDQCWVSLRRLFELDDRQGGGTVYAMASRMARHLQDAVGQASYSPSVGRDLGKVTSATMEHAGWLAYDSGRHEDARRWWLETCHLADMADLPEARVTALASMSLQAGSTAGRGREAADLAGAARAAAGDGASPTLLSVLAAREAVGLAQVRDAAGAVAAVAASRRWLGLGRPGDEPLWLGFLGAARPARPPTPRSPALGRAK